MCIVCGLRTSRGRSMAVQEVDTDEPGPRPAQRRRTRKAIVAAAAELLKAGETPSVGQVAEAADVSRRTVYQYFPTLEQLLIDATLGLLDQSAVDAAIEAADPVDDAEARVTALITAIAESATEQLPLGRQLIRLTVETPPARRTAPPGAGTGGRPGSRAPSSRCAPGWHRSASSCWSRACPWSSGGRRSSSSPTCAGSIR